MTFTFDLELEPSPVTLLIEKKLNAFASMVYFHLNCRMSSSVPGIKYDLTNGKDKMFYFRTWKILFSEIDLYQRCHALEFEILSFIFTLI